MMKKSLLHLSKTLLIICLFSTTILAQDVWTPSEINGFGNPMNPRVKCMHVFKGNIYAGAGEDTGMLYSSSTGNFGSWSAAFSAVSVVGIDKITSTNEGGGYMFVSAYAYGSEVPKVYRTFDGSSYNLYYTGTDRIDNIVAFKGQGSVDSIYVFEQKPFGTFIKRSSYNSNDPSDTLASWDSILDFSQVSPYTRATCTYVYNGKLYFGTNNYNGTLWSSATGRAFAQNDSVGSGFGDGNNIEISALGSFGGYLYVGTNTNSTGAQVWRSNNDSTWTKVTEFPGYGKITSFQVFNSQLWVSMATSTNGTGQIVKSSDGLTFTISENKGFNYSYNEGFYGNMTVFGNDLYFASENYGYPSIGTPIGSQNMKGFGGGFSTGGQIWRTCLGTAPTISVGPDQIVCSGITANFTADAGFASYAWSDGSANQTLSTTNPGSYYVVATDFSGCDALDTANLTTTTSPSINVINPVEGMPVSVCKGDSIHLINTASSNLRINVAPFSKVTNDTINDYSTVFDTINVSGINDYASSALLSVTIDSLNHTNDGDLDILLYAPDGSFIYLSRYNGYFSQNYTNTVFTDTAKSYISDGYGPFTGFYRPYTPLNTSSGNADGPWTLSVYDNVGGNDHGTLKGWSIRFSVADTILTFTWTPSTGLSSSSILNPVATPLVNTNYTLKVTNNIGCSAQFTDSISVPSISITTTSDSLCSGSTALLNSAGGFNPSWSPAATLSTSTGITVMATPTSTTTYYVNDTVSGCPVTDSIKIYSNPALIASASSAPQSICYGDSTIITGSATGGTSPYAYLWSNGSDSTIQQVGPLGSTTYTLNITDAFGCTQVTTTDITVVPSTDVYGHVGFGTSGDVTSSTVVLYKYLPFLTHFDTVQTTTTDASGNFHFAAVNHLQYLVEVFPNATYTTLLPTYYGDTCLWTYAARLVHGCGMNDSINIKAVTELGLIPGPGYLHGVIRQDVGFNRAPGDPVPGIDVKLGRNPGGAIFAGTQSDANGEYSFPGVPYGSYVVFADIPGLGRDSSYTFVVDPAHSIYNYLDYLIDSTEIRIDTVTSIGIFNPAKEDNSFSVYPNPSKGNAMIEYKITSDSQVSLGIYNVLGVKVTELVNARQSNGTYKVSINEKNKNLSSGVYFVSLTANGLTSIHKIIVTE